MIKRNTPIQALDTDLEDAIARGKETNRQPRDAQWGDGADTREAIFEGGAENHDTTGPGAFFDPDCIDLDEPGEEHFLHLSDLLVYLRETYAERLADGKPLGAKLSLSANKVAAYLKEHGYTMSSGSYSLLEQGKTLPGDPVAFFTHLCDCLAIKSTSKYRPLLLYQYLFDSAARSIGDSFAEKYVERGDCALQNLREKKALQAARPRRTKARSIGRRTAQRVFAQ